MINSSDNAAPGEDASVSETVTEVVLGSQIQERVVIRIYKLRHPDALMGQEYEAALAAYDEDRGDLPEVEDTVKDGWSSYKSRGFYRLVDGKPMFTARPQPLNPLAYRYSGYDKSMRRHGLGLGLASELGVLAGSDHNRDIRPDRVECYTEAMLNGEWKDLLPDPITITRDGLNGQHRVAAAATAWSGKCTRPSPEPSGGSLFRRPVTVLPPNDPAFLVVWGVSPDEAALADGSRRTDHDHAVITTKARNRAA